MVVVVVVVLKVVEVVDWNYYISCVEAAIHC